MELLIGSETHSGCGVLDHITSIPAVWCIAIGNLNLLEGYICIVVSAELPGAMYRGPSW